MKKAGSNIFGLLFGFLLSVSLPVLADSATALNTSRMTVISEKQTKTFSAPAKMESTIRLTTGKADTVDLGRPVADILVANPAIADVGTLRADRLYIVGKAVGDTNILAFDAEGNQMADITVHVRVDEMSIRDTLHAFFPKERVTVHTVKNEVVLAGRVSTPGVANQVRDLASRFFDQQDKTIVDLMKVEGEQQVMLKVRVIEANRSVLREYGINNILWQSAGGSQFATGTAQTTPGIGLTQAPFGIGQLVLARRGNFGPLEFNLRGLERNGLINTLAEPNLTAISGETAGFLAGGEYPVPVGRDRDGNITLEFKQFGVSLNFTPTVLSEDNISLQLSTEVSDLSNDNSITIAGTRIPGLTVRRAETTVQIGSGGTIMMAGLIRSGTIEALNGLPGVKDIPILGELFKSKSFTRNETELVILVTPYIVEPFADENAVVAEANASAGMALPPAFMLPDGTTPASADYGVIDEAAIAEPMDLPPAAAPEPVKSAPLPAPVPRKKAELEDMPAIPARKPQIAKALPPARKKEDGPVLSQAFMKNMRSVYGANTPATPAAHAPFGYMVD